MNFRFSHNERIGLFLPFQNSFEILKCSDVIIKTVRSTLKILSGQSSLRSAPPVVAHEEFSNTHFRQEYQALFIKHLAVQKYSLRHHPFQYFNTNLCLLFPAFTLLLFQETCNMKFENFYFEKSSLFTIAYEIFVILHHFCFTIFDLYWKNYAQNTQFVGL